jgi:hypothetical protein
MMTTFKRSLQVGFLFAALVATTTTAAGVARADGDTAGAARSVSKSGIPYKADDDSAGPKELLDAIRSRRPGGKLLNLDRMLLQSPRFAASWPCRESCASWRSCRSAS